MEEIKFKYLVLLMKNYARCRCEFITARQMVGYGISDPDVFTARLKCVAAEQSEYRAEIEALFPYMDNIILHYVKDIFL